MVEFNELCSAAANALTLDQLLEGCTNYAAAWGSSAQKLGLAIGAGFLAAVVLLIQRLVSGEGVGPVVLAVFEGVAYGAIGLWAGASAGSMLALLLPPGVSAALFIVLMGIGVFVTIWALAKGDAKWEKAVGVFALAALLLILLLPTIFALAIPSEGPARDAYEDYVLWVSVTFGITGWAGALMAAMFRGYFYGLGLVLVLINASWGLIGNVLGLFNHFASTFFFKDWGDVDDDKRIFYVHYRKGFHLKSGFDFTWGDAVSGTTVEEHEAVHVLQHLILGPIFPISHAIWAVLMLIPGLIAGAIKRSDAFKGVMDLSYYNNPWEVIAYAWKGTRHDGANKQPLIFNDVLAWILTVLWILSATVAFVVYWTVRA